MIKFYPNYPRPCEENQQQNERPPGRRRRRDRNHGRESGIHGNLLKRRKNDCVQLISWNCGGIGFVSDNRCKGTIKLEKFLGELQRDYEVDYICLSELNKDMRNFISTESLHGAIPGWTEHSRVQVGTNTF